MFPRRNRLRALLLALATALTLLYVLTPSGPPRSAPEAVRLAWHMNHRAPNPRFKKSTFNFRVPPANPPPSPLSIPPPPSLTPLPRIQHPFPDDAPDPLSASRRREVAALFRADWAAYRAHAWGRDALLPLSLRGRDQFSGWAATLVDALPALHLLGLRPEFDEAVAHVAASLDFGTSTSNRLNTFETTIRYLGGLLSAYELSGRDALLGKAVELGDLLYAAFDTPGRLPVDWIDLRRPREGRGQTPEGRVVAAAPGTLSLEMTRLSQATGDARYFDAASRVMRLFAEGQDETAIPGLWPVWVSMKDADVVNGTRFTLGGGADSMYEYLPKMHVLLEGGDPMYERMTRRFLKASEELFFRPMLPKGVEDDILVSGSAEVHRDGRVELKPETEHLTCFIGGAFALAGRALRDEAAVETGRRLARGCAYLYSASPKGIMPERLTLVPCPSSSPSSPCPWDQTLYEEERAERRWKEDPPPPFTSVKDPRYLLRPEAAESLFVLYRVTGEEEFRERGWEMFLRIREGTGGGGWSGRGVSAGVRDVLKEGEREREDYMESFWFSETLKYLYLLFSPPSLLSLDEYVLTTEAHPLRRHGPLSPPP